MSQIKNIIVSAAIAIDQIGDPMLAEQVLSGEATIGRLVAVAAQLDNEDRQVVTEYISIARGGA